METDSAGVRAVPVASRAAAARATRPTPQAWHVDYPHVLSAGARGLVTVFVYLTPVTRANGATEFRVHGRRTMRLPGPRGTVVTFQGRRVTHRGHVNTTAVPRDVLALTFVRERTLAMQGPS